jgi:hypothetical protein
MDRVSVQRNEGKVAGLTLSDRAVTGERTTDCLSYLSDSSVLGELGADSAVLESWMWW